MSDFRIKHLPDSISRQEPATKNNVDERKPLITVWAEASGEISGEEYKLSFGSGFEGRGRRRSGYTMMAQGRIRKMGMAASSIGNPVSGIARTNIVINGREQGQYYVVILGGQYSGTTVVEQPLRLNQGDRINFNTTNPEVCCAVVSLLIELDL